MHLLHHRVNRRSRSQRSACRQQLPSRKRGFQREPAGFEAAVVEDAQHSRAIENYVGGRITERPGIG